MNKNEFLIYINAYLEPLEILNTVSNCEKDFGFKELNLIDDNLELSLKKFLETPNWEFKCVQINDNWKEKIITETSWAFEDIVTEIHGYPSIFGKNEFKNMVEKYQLDIIQRRFFEIIFEFMSQFEDYQVYKVVISNQFDDDGYFAHGEYNALFKTSNSELFLLYFRDSD